jgi:iron complex transport system substrate-binding protein
VKDKTGALQPADLPSLYYVRADLLTTVGDEGHNEIFRICGGKNVVTNAASPYSVKVSLENLYGWDPEVIIIRDRSPLSVADVLSDPRLGNLKAVKSKRVYKEHPGWMEYRLETPFGILEKAKWLHPALFDDLNPETEFQSFVNLLREFNR